MIGLSFGFDHLGPVGHGVGQNLGTGGSYFCCCCWLASRVSCCWAGSYLSVVHLWCALHGFDGFVFVGCFGSYVSFDFGWDCLVPGSCLCFGNILGLCSSGCHFVCGCCCPGFGLQCVWFPVHWHPAKLCFD